MATLKELRGIAMLRILSAIEALRRERKLATTSSISPLVGRSVRAVGNILAYSWDWGYVNRKPVRKKRTNKNLTAIFKRRKYKSMYHYTVSPKGKTRIQTLIMRFGTLDQINRKKEMENQKKIVLPSDSISEGV